jgi:GTP cyclohydrolase II
MLSPIPSELLARARSDLRIGLPIVIDNTIIIASEHMTQARLDSFKLKENLQLVLTDWRAKTLNLGVYDGDLVRVKVPSAIDLKWIKAISDPTKDLDQPIKGPLIPIRDDNSSIARTAIMILKEAQLLPSALMADLPNGKSFATSNNLSYLNYDILNFTDTSTLEVVICAQLPLSVAKNSIIHIFRPKDGAEEHYAIEIGSPSRAPAVLTRIHSACFTGDVLGSLKCDCGPQLKGAIEQIGKEGSGLLIYLNQEGRGIGLANKIRAYSLQDQGFDTVDANHRLGFEDDERDFKLGAQIIKKLGFSKIKLLTNNLRKVSVLEENGVIISERLPLIHGKTAHNASYLRTKVDKSGHILD